MPTFRVVSGAPADAGVHSHWYEGASFSNPADGGFVHVVSGGGSENRYPGGAPGPLHPGMIYQVDTAESFSSGAQLATDGSGHARVASAGDVLVATALEGSSGSGDEVWVVAETQRVV